MEGPYDNSMTPQEHDRVHVANLPRKSTKLPTPGFLVSQQAKPLAGMGQRAAEWCRACLIVGVAGICMRPFIPLHILYGQQPMALYEDKRDAYWSAYTSGLSDDAARFAPQPAQRSWVCYNIDRAATDPSKAPARVLQTLAGWLERGAPVALSHVMSAFGVMVSCAHTIASFSMEMGREFALPGFLCDPS